MQPISILIVGRGVFGASTALELAQSLPNARITVIDQAPVGSHLLASNDINKIIRADYEDPFYIQLALKAQGIWKSHPMYSHFWHKADHVFLDGTGSAQKILEKFRNLGIKSAATMISVEEMKLKYPCFFDDVDCRGQDQTYINPDCGWDEAEAALQAVCQEAMRLGVRFEQHVISRLEFDDNDICLGVQKEEGHILKADRIILAAGAGIIQILANTSTEKHYFPLQDRILAAGVVSGVINLTDSQRKRLAALPIFVRDLDPIDGEVLPPTGRLLKFASEVSFKNSVFHAKSGQTISVPPRPADKTGWPVPNALKKECGIIRESIFGAYGEDLSFDSHRICWDAVSADGDFLISDHPTYHNLFFATCGSFHSWKFLPILGELVLSMLERSLPKDVAQRWAWDREMPSTGHGGLFPNREWRQFLDDALDGEIMG